MHPDLPIVLSPPRFTLFGQSIAASAPEAGLYVVSTPIGNLSDITIRALQILAGSALIACEDTRTSGVLLRHYGIDVPRLSYTEHNATERHGEIIARIGRGEAISLISDAGTPIVNDPGRRLVAAVIDAGFEVVPVPGANAPLAALVAAGLDDEAFRFGGFVPSKKGERDRFFAELANETATTILFEAPTRILATLDGAMEALGADRRAVVARELTKMHETFYRGTLGDIRAALAALPRIRGEIVLLIGGGHAAPPSLEDIEPALRAALATMKPGKAASAISAETGLSRQALYNKALALKAKP